MSDDKLSGFVRCIQDAEKNHAVLAREWQRMYEVYVGKPDDRKLRRRRQAADWRNKLFIPHAFQQVETLLPEFMVEDPNFEVVPREASDQDRAGTVQALLDYQLDRDRYAEKRMRAVKKAIVFGACPVKVTWAYEVKRLKVRNQMSAEERAAALLAGEDVPAFVEQDVTLRDDPTMIVVDPFDFMWDPAATTIDDAQYVLHRSWLTADQLRAKERAGLYEGVSDHLASSGKDAKGSGMGDWAKRLFSETDDERDARRGDRHEVIEKWTRDRLMVIVDRRVIVRDVPNPYWHNQIPFVMVTTQSDIDKVTGLSEVWSIAPLQEALWKKQNAQYDAVDLTLDPPLAIGDARHSEVQFRPGARIITDNPQGIRPLDIGQTGHYIGGQEVDRLTGMIERMTGINASISGTSNEGTATEAAMNLRQGKSRIALKVANVDRAFARAAEMMIQLDQQFVDSERVIRIVGDAAQWETVSAADIAGAFDVRPRNSTDRTVKELAREQSLNMLNTFAQFTALGYDIDPLIQKAAEVHDLPPIQRSTPAASIPVSDPGGEAPMGVVSPDGLDANGFAPDALTGDAGA